MAGVCKSDWPHRPALLSVKKTGLPYSLLQSQNIRALLKALQPLPLPPAWALQSARAVPCLALAEPSALKRGSHTDFTPAKHLNPFHYII